MKLAKSGKVLSLVAIVAFPLAVAVADEGYEGSPIAKHPSLAAKHPLAANTRTTAKLEAEKLAKAKAEEEASKFATSDKAEEENARARLSDKSAE